MNRNILLFRTIFYSDILFFFFRDFLLTLPQYYSLYLNTFKAFTIIMMLFACKSLPSGLAFFRIRSEDIPMGVLFYYGMFHFLITLLGGAMSYGQFTHIIGDFLGFLKEKLAKISIFH